MATASQKIMLTRFLATMAGTLQPALVMDTPTMKIPLERRRSTIISNKYIFPKNYIRKHTILFTWYQSLLITGLFYILQALPLKLQICIAAHKARPEVDGNANLATFMLNIVTQPLLLM